jgi:LysM repeat protein
MIMNLTNAILKAVEIIKANEGKYNSVNPDDHGKNTAHGALSIGCCQWHGDRAKALLESIIKNDPNCNIHLPLQLVKECLNPKLSWKNRILTASEKTALTVYLSRDISKEEQDNLITKDVTGYVKLIAKKGNFDTDTIVFLADIYNQSPTACNRIIKDSLILKDNPSLDEVMKVAITDKVIQDYSSRRYRVYLTLTGKVFTLSDNSLDYVIKHGDTLTKIARTYNTTVAKIAKDNEIKNINRISAGQHLTIYPNTNYTK